MTPRGIFYKMTGSGNDFVFLDGRQTPAEDWSPDLIRTVCARRTGVGADGLVILEPATGARVRFNYFNADGSRGEMCGNGALCATNLAFRLGLATADRVELETDAGIVTGTPGEAQDEAIIELGRPTGVRDLTHDIDLEPGESSLWAAVAGVPHVVVLVESLEAPQADPEVRGRALRQHPAFQPAGANANFASPSVDGFSYRTFERGVEAETLACGTGALCVADVLVRLGRASFPVRLVTRSGQVVTVSEGESADTFTLRGQARLVYRGSFEV